MPMTLRSEYALCRLCMEEGLFVVMAGDDSPRHSVRNRPKADIRPQVQRSRAAYPNRSFMHAAAF